jgi:Single-strand binding protein family
MTEPSVSFAGNLTDDPELRHTESGIARAMFRVAVSGAGRGAGAIAAVGDGDHDQDHAQPVASSTDATGRDAKHGVPLRRVRAVEGAGGVSLLAGD